jgi:hypothetical protein
VSNVLQPWARRFPEIQVSANYLIRPEKELQDKPCQPKDFPNILGVVRNTRFLISRLNQALHSVHSQTNMGVKLSAGLTDMFVERLH